LKTKELKNTSEEDTATPSPAPTPPLAKQTSVEVCVSACCAPALRCFLCARLGYRLSLTHALSLVDSHSHGSQQTTDLSARWCGLAAKAASACTQSATHSAGTAAKRAAGAGATQRSASAATLLAGSRPAAAMNSNAECQPRPSAAQCERSTFSTHCTSSSRTPTCDRAPQGGESAAECTPLPVAPTAAAAAVRRQHGVGHGRVYTSLTHRCVEARMPVQRWKSCES
jgi:hypothetical protein